MIKTKCNILLIFIFIVSCSDIKPLKTGLEGKTLPEFSLFLPESSSYLSTNQISKNHPFVILYFSPHCTYCKAEIKDILSNIDDVKNLHFYFVTNFPPPEIKEFQATYNIRNYSNISLAQDTGFNMGNYFGTTGVPFTAIYGKEKKLKSSFIGKMTASQIKEVATE